MDNATRVTNLEVTGDLEVGGTQKLNGLTASTYQVSAENGAAAAGSAPTKAEFDAVVTLANELKTKYNALVTKLSTGA